MSGIQSIDIGVGDLVFGDVEQEDGRFKREAGEVLDWRDPWHIEIEIIEDPDYPFFRPDWDWDDDEDPGTAVVLARTCSIIKRASEWKTKAERKRVLP